MAGNGQPRAHPVVCLDQRADGETRAVDVEPTRGRAGAALELVADHARAPARVAFAHGAGSGGVYGLPRQSFGDVQPVDVVQHAVVGLGHDGHCPEVVRFPGCAVSLDHPADCRRVAWPDGMGVRDQDRPGQPAAVTHPVRPGHLAIAVEAELPGPDGFGLGIASARQDRGDAGLHLNAPRRQAWIARREQLCRADFDPRHVGDGVERPGRSGQRHSQRAGAGFGPAGHFWRLDRK